MKGKIVVSILLILSLFVTGSVISAEEAKPESSEKKEEVASYEITDQSLTKLKEKELPEDILENLKGLKDQKYTTKEEFLDVLEKTIGKDQAVQYKSQILKAAFYYSSEGRREPFKSPFDPTPTPPVLTPIPNGSCDTPLGQFDLGQFRVIGVLLGEPGDHARVLAPDGKSYTIKVGTCIGKFKGKVISISDNCVLVKEIRRYQKDDKIIVEEPETQLCINPLEKEKTP